jgi:hypothetical protein
MSMGMRPNAKAGNASIGFNYGTGVVSDAQMAAEREADLERLQRVYEDAAAAATTTRMMEAARMTPALTATRDSDDSDDDDAVASAADPSDSLDTSALPVVLSIDAVELLARGYGVLQYGTLHEHNAGI